MVSISALLSNIARGIGTSGWVDYSLYITDMNLEFLSLVTKLLVVA